MKTATKKLGSGNRQRKKVNFKKSNSDTTKKLSLLKNKKSAKQTREQQEESLLVKNMIIIAAIAMYYSINKATSGLVTEGIVIAIAVAVVIAGFFILKAFKVKLYARGALITAAQLFLIS